MKLSGRSLIAIRRTNLGATMTTQKIDNWLQFSTVIFGLLVVFSELAGWPGSSTIAFGLVGAFTALAAYFTGKSTEAAFETQGRDAGGRASRPQYIGHATSGPDRNISVQSKCRVSPST